LPPGADIRKELTNYLASELVQFAEPDYERRGALMPNDPYLSDGKLWGLNNYGQQGGLPGADIDAPEAWDILTSASNVIVAVLDTGIRATHQDFAGNTWTNPIAGGYGWNALNDTVYPADDEGHGCLVSGVIGAKGNNGKGVVGVAWSVQLMACKCLNAQRIGYDSDLIACIEFARTNGAKILNVSLGDYVFSHALSNAIYAARQDGVILVAACGNDGRNIDSTPYYPASYDIDNIVSVAFTTRNDALGAASNYGAENVDLAAPGADVHSTFFAADNSYLGGSFLSGTSLAAPMVSGALALAIARFPNEPHTITIQRVLGSVTPITALAGRCRTGGRLNLKNVLSPPINLNVFRAAGKLTIKGHTGPNRACSLEVSNDLNSWLPLCDVESSAEGFFEISDSPPPGESPRFYRATADP
jgi:subtilisin family serine protease